MIEQVYSQALQMIDEQQQLERYFFDQKVSKLRKLAEQRKYMSKKKIFQRDQLILQNDFDATLLQCSKTHLQTLQGNNIVEAVYILVKKIIQKNPQGGLMQMLPLIEQDLDQNRQDNPIIKIQDQLNNGIVTPEFLQRLQQQSKEQQYLLQDSKNNSSKFSQSKINKRTIQQVEAQYQNIINQLIKSHQQSTQMAQQQFRKLIQQKLNYFQTEKQQASKLNCQLMAKVQRLDLQKFEAIQQLFNLKSQFDVIQQKHQSQIKNLTEKYEKQVQQLQQKLQTYCQQNNQLCNIKQQQYEQKIMQLKLGKDQQILDLKKQLQEAIDNLRNQLNTRNQQYLQLQQNIKEQIGRMYQQIQLKDAEITETKSCVKQRDSKIQFLQAKVSQYLLQIDDLQNKRGMILQEVNYKQDFINHLKFQLQNRSKQIQNLNIAKQNAQKHIQALQNTNQTLRSQIMGYLARESKEREMYQQIIKLKVALRNYQSNQSNQQLNSKLQINTKSSQVYPQHRNIRTQNLRSKFQSKLSNIRSKMKLPINHKNPCQIHQQNEPDRYFQVDHIKQEYTPSKTLVFPSSQQQYQKMHQMEEKSIINNCQNINFINQIPIRRRINTIIKIQEQQNSIQISDRKLKVHNQFSSSIKINIDKQLEEQINKQLQQLRKKRNKYKQGIYSPRQYSKDSLDKSKEDRSKLNRWKSSQNLGKAIWENNGKNWQMTEKQQKSQYDRYKSKENIRFQCNQQHLTPKKANQNSLFDIYPSSSGKKQFSILDKFNNKIGAQKFRLNSSQQSVD